MLTQYLRKAARFLVLCWRVLLPDCQPSVVLLISSAGSLGGLLRVINCTALLMTGKCSLFQVASPIEVPRVSFSTLYSSDAFFQSRSSSGIGALLSAISTARPNSMSWSIRL